MTTFYGILVAAVDFYETINALGKVGPHHTAEEVKNPFSDTHPIAFLRAFVIFPDYLGVETNDVDTRESTVSDNAPGSVETTNHFGACLRAFEASDKSSVVEEMGKTTDRYVFLSLGKSSNVHVPLGVCLDYERIVFDEVTEKTC